MFCRNCGEQLVDGAEFCIKCGSKVGNEKQSEYNAQERSNQVSSSVHEVKTDHMWNVGNQRKRNKSHENYSYARRLGFVLVAICAGYTYISKGEVELGPIGDFTIIVLPFLIELLYPFSDEWGFFRKTWCWFWQSILLILWHFLITVFVISGLSMITAFI